MKRFRWPILVGIAIIGAAAFLRLRYLEYSEIGADQQLTLDIALAWVSRGIFPLVANKSSFGLMNPALVEYVYAIPLFISRDIVGVAWLTALLNLAAILIPTWVVARVFGGRVALLAVLLYALNPWSVHYSRLIWNQTLVPFFASLLFASLLYYLSVRPRPRVLILVPVWLALAIQAHWTSIALVPVVGIVILGFRRRLRLRELSLGTALAFVSFGPYLVYQARAGFPDFGVLVGGLSNPATTSLASLLVVLDLLQTKGVFATLGPFAEEWRRASVFWTALDGLAVLLFVLGAGYAIALTVRKARARETSRWSDQDRGHVLLVLWVLLPVMLFLRHSHYLQNYYFLWVYPAPFVLMVLPFEALFHRLRRIDRSGKRSLFGVDVRVGYPLVYAPVVALALGQGQIDLAGQEILLSGRPGRQQIRHVSEAIDKSHALLTEWPGCTLVVVSDGFNAETSRLAVLSESLGPHRVRFAAGGQGMLAPDPCAVYLAAAQDDRSQAWFSHNARPLASATIQTPAETWRFYVVSREDRASLAAAWDQRETLGEWAHGLQLSHYEVAPLGPSASELDVTLVWRVARAPPAERYHFFVHVVDGAGGLVSQFDGPGVDSLRWQEDDLLWTWFTLALPSDLQARAYDVVVGSYEWPSLNRVALSDGRDALIAARIEASP